ncbi:phosphoribosylformylglycinamidine cyclo-ligase [Quadrisphaera granulorum]|uniref:Phosphoribosylformylglycinamidine cyclo-ligase n=1 Tax=Quadrisphaera granulorum TaxID=317664 RepID=A0A315ZQG6_9ACTN|nr:phosphoribosylformylglycinamidine cyclo-ligase [Quadrisphaera granulorum]PWJ47835.1 phosphoribosylformylglycinamidine cyclo-ligase [Quadrisphaera granulorum]SZE98602.1 phosphoribosylformylglycinamidine cyclo-ligase [Quadrisphaera granulorum]
MSTSSAPAASAYAAAGVDVEAGDRAVVLMKEAVARTHGAQVVGGAGGFAGLFDASALLGYKRPLLATSTDGVGTKVAVAQALDVHHTVGQDLVAMVVDDLVVCGARPLFMTDYIACGRVVPERIAAVVGGIARACEEVGAALVGGETAEHPGLLGPDEYDVAGAATGVVEADALLGPDRVRAGDVVVAMASSGLHSNGYSLVRRLLADAGWGYERHVAELGRTVGEELLEPTALYTRPCLALADALGERLHAFSHVTGGGLASNLARVLPAHLDADVDRSTWTPLPVFSVLRTLGGVSREDAEATWNQGVGMVAVLDAGAADDALASLRNSGVQAWVAGAVRNGGDNETATVRGSKGVDGGGVRLVGDHPE